MSTPAPAHTDGETRKEIPMRSEDLEKLYLYRSFDDFTEGTLCKNIRPFTACDAGVVSSAHKYPGGYHSFKTSIKAGDHGWGRWGYEITDGFPRVTSGGEVWFRQAMYFPVGFNFRNSNSSLKTFRFGRQDGGNGNRGCIDIQIMNNMGWRSTIEFEQDHWTVYDGGKVIPGTWQMFEVYVKFHPTQGIIRMWRDGELFAEQLNEPTLRSSDRLYRLLMNTYWNGDAPATQSHYYDHITIAVNGGGRNDGQYLGTDSRGNKQIGMTTYNDDEGTTPPPVEPPIEPPVEPPVEPPIEPPVEPPTESAPWSTMSFPGGTITVTEKAISVVSDLPVVVTSPTA